ncbi:ferrichrome ABC transporter substrate-binding protein [Tardiphaga sp.]|uniref:ferrichrome ABC transporter substrate-binding protein n=1 Tax=Tardiphaga sp. TaxID=1926292 RepID=UPI002629E453|nr:ferrichrome ABC transporter substrate-binding protein [Tardiphaga sp.]MDB5620642.1 hypothetical protein [Tardiphaga sp.]
MRQAIHSARISGSGSRLRRLPFVLALTLGLLLSLIHCAGDGFALAADGSAIIAMNDSGATPNVPDEMLPAHSGHCLSHVTAPATTLVSMPAELTLRAPAFAGAEAPASLAGLPLFKPPRA